MNQYPLDVLEMHEPFTFFLLRLVILGTPRSALSFMEVETSVIVTSVCIASDTSLADSSHSNLQHEMYSATGIVHRTSLSLPPVNTLHVVSFNARI